MSRRGGRKRKEDEALAVSDDDEEERKENKRGKTSGAAASSSSAAAAAAASSVRTQLAPAAAASSSPAASAAASSSRPPVHVEDVKCGACWEAFTCADDSAHLPRTVPCGHLLCTACIRQNLALTPGSVPCPLQHGPQTIRIPAGSAAAALSTVDDWVRLLPPALELIASIKNQQSLMTRIGQQGARCSRPGCESTVTHYCSKCLDLCAEHERSRHAALPSHKAATMPIAQKDAFLRDEGQSEVAEVASAIRSRREALLKQQRLATQRIEAEFKQAEAQMLAKKIALQSSSQTLSALQQTMDQMRAADDDTVIEMDAELSLASPAPLPVASPAPVPVAAAFDKRGSTVLNTLTDARVAALLSFLGPARSLSKATLIYRGSRDGFKAKDWWRKCGGKSNVLTLVRVKGNEFVFGAFTPFRWPVDLTASVGIADPAGSTFLFSLVNAHGRAVKLRLKESDTARAGGATPGEGPYFGHDLALMFGDRSADTLEGNWTQPYSFEFDCVADGGAPVAYDKTLLAGDDGKRNDHVDFAAAEVECWQL